MGKYNIILNEIKEEEEKQKAEFEEKQIEPKVLSEEEQKVVDKKSDDAINKEIKHIAIGCGICSIITCLLFIAFKKWNFGVLFGLLLGNLTAIITFVYLGRSIQRALELKDNGQRYLQKTSKIRLLIMVAGAILAIELPFIDTIAGIAPLFFPRLTIFGMQLLGMYKPDEYKK